MKKVLIVDPSKTFGHFLRYVLLRLGYDAAHVTSPARALEIIGTARPSLVTTEVHMKELDGMELCRRVRDARYEPRIPVVIVSVDGTEETKLLAEGSGCVEYLTKPVTFKAIHELMERHLSFGHKRQSLRAKLALRAVVDDGEKEAEMSSATLSEGGIYLCTETPAEAGKALKIRLFLPGLRSPITLGGEVVYCVKTGGPGIAAGMGIKFVGLDQDIAAHLRRYVESYLADFVPEEP